MHQLVATAAFGLEAVVVRELSALGYESRITRPGRIEFSGDDSAICRANLWLRSADRVLVQLAKFQAADFDALFDTVRELPWENWMASDAAIPVRGRSHKSQLTSVPAVQRSVKKAIVERLFKQRFPDSGIFRGTKWTDPESGKVYENDLLVVIDRFAIVIECKAGFVDPPARRGAEYRVVDTLQSLVVDPAKQAKRFAKFLSDNRKVHSLKSEGRKATRIDNTDVEYYVPISVTYDDLGMVSANLRTCMEGGLIEESDSLVPSLSVSDLEVIFEILENELEVLHYLMRRAELEAQIRYLGDEGDLLAFYLDSGFNLGDLESSTTHSFNLILKSKELDPFFTAKARGKKVEKPRRKLTKWWRDIINFILTRKPQYWSEIGYLLLNVQFDEQRDFERKVKNVSSRVKHGLSDLPHGWVILKTAPQNRSYLIVGYPYPSQGRKERDDNLKNIIQSVPLDEGVLGVVCIGLSANRPEYPYNVLAYAPRSLINEKTREITKYGSEPLGSETR